MEALFGLPLAISAAVGAALIGIFVYRKYFAETPPEPVYDSPTDRISPEVSHGNSEPHA
jgi:hypothetical protein